MPRQTGSIFAHWITPRLPALLDRHPGLPVELVASNDNLSVSRREADIAIRLARPASGDFLIRKLADVGFGIYGAARGDLPVQPGDWVAYNQDLAHTPEMQRLEAMLGKGRVRLRSNSLRGLARGVGDGIGHGILPCFQPPGSPGTVCIRGKRTLRSFVVPHIPHDDVVLPDEVQGLRAFGSETEAETLAGVIAGHLDTMRNKHAITLEHLRMGALKGVILDADGSVLYELFAEVKIAPKTIAFDLGNAATKVKPKCIATLAAIEDGLKGEYMNSVHCLCSPEFFTALTSHGNVEKAFETWQNGAILINDVRRGFTFGGITFEEYRGQANDPETGDARRFIAANGSGN